MSDPQITAIKRERFDELCDRDIIMIVRSDYGYRVEQWSHDSVAPSSDYDTAQEAAARACQLLGLKEAVTPQNWPEIAQIGGDGRRLPKPKGSGNE